MFSSILGFIIKCYIMLKRNSSIFCKFCHFLEREKSEKTCSLKVVMQKIIMLDETFMRNIIARSQAQLSSTGAASRHGLVPISGCSGWRLLCGLRITVTRKKRPSRNVTPGRSTIGIRTRVHTSKMLPQNW